MNHEINIVELLKSRRYFKMAFHKLLSQTQRLQLKKASRYICIDPDSPEEDTSNNCANNRTTTKVKLFGSSKNTSYQNHNSIVTLTDGFSESSCHNNVNNMGHPSA